MYNKKGFVVVLVIATQFIAMTANATQGSDGIFGLFNKITTNSNSIDEFPKNLAERRRSSEVSNGTTITIRAKPTEPQNAVEARRNAGQI